MNSVIFGITLMVLVALYVAVGSGLPSVREYFEMTELPFFNAWPFKILMWLLCLNLATVTFTRIPFTPPRYGVWMIHAGIITLIFGTAYYYRNKVEGLAIVMKRGSTEWFYDKDERALHIRIGGVPVMQHPLPSLPRFRPYGEQFGNLKALNKPDLTNITPYIEFSGKDGRSQTKKLSSEMGFREDLKLDVVGYYPWGTVKTTFAEDATTGPAGIKLNIPNPHAAGETNEYLIGSDAQSAATLLGEIEFEHRPVTADELKATTEAATKIHRLDVKAPGYEGSLFVEPTKTYALGTSGYSITVESFDPEFPAMNGERVKLLTFMVKPPTGEEFRRQVIFGRPKPTDWKLNEPGAGPMGKRQTEPLDAQLETAYTFADPEHLISRNGTEKRLLLTTEDGKLTVISTGTRTAAAVEPSTDGKATLALGTPGSAMAVKVNVTQVPHVKREQHVDIIPPNQRDSRAGEAGIFQVVMVKVSLGDWSEVVPVPYITWPAEAGQRWDGGSVTLPGSGLPLQLALGQTRLPLPAKVTLDNFELVKYPGTIGDNGVMRDFKSTLTIEPREGGGGPVGPRTTDVAHMNNPVYWGGIGNTYWTFFQAQWDPNGQRYTVLGVGNRPGVWIMTAGSALMVIGLIYAFYLKPVIISRMKRKAIERAAEVKAQKQKSKGEEVAV